MQIKNTWIHDSGKFKIALDKNDKDVSEQLKNSGHYEDELMTVRIFKKYLKSGMTVLDLGANIGYYTMLARSIVGPKGKVFAFEPSPSSIKLIKASIKENSFANVIAVETAVSNKTGKAKLYLSPLYISEHSLLDYHYSSGRSSEKSINVKTITIDDYFEKNVGNFKIDFIKMDIEGSESRALEGMKRVLEENKKLIMITEFCPNCIKFGNRNPRDFLEKLLHLGFKIFHIDEFKKRVYPVSVEEMLKIADFRIKNIIEKNKINDYGTWYTNLLCVR
jgi:FkbM family methyltransferase